MKARKGSPAEGSMSAPNQPKNAATAKNARDFFQWVYANGDAQAKALDYVPLPASLVQQVEAYWQRNIKP